MNNQDPNNFVSVENIHWDSKVQQMMQELNVEVSLISGFKVKCNNIYTELAAQMKRRFTGINNALLHLSATDPDTRTMEIKPKSLNDAVNDEWRNLSFYLEKKC